ncbi:hypothetical protein NDU88_008836 [Pleurodeles waltl]|uniref:Uncharacterized protein n=1 Tax=Pleurodeles waltl TaxID=8319 RepID=A0AAV7QSW5_PLEWA|nr:hypothetical protein NDU88_008836 [Pleurodeles waltl]
MYQELLRTIREVGVQRQDGGREWLAASKLSFPRLLCDVFLLFPPTEKIMRAAPDAYIYGNHFSNRIARGIGELIRSFLGDFGHNGRGVLISAFAIFLPPRGRQWRMAPKAVRGSRSKPGLQERRPLDSQPPVRGGITKNSSLGSTGGGDNVPEGRQPAFGSFAALGQTHKAKNGAKQIGEKEEAVTIPRMFKSFIIQPLWGAVLL